MPNLLRFVMTDGASIVAACEPVLHNVAQTNLSLEGGLEQEASVHQFLTFVRDDSVESVHSNRVRAILPVERDFQVPSDTAVFRFALIA